MYRKVMWGTLALFLGGCAIKQEIKPAEALSTAEKKEVCVIKNASVRESFLEAYRSALTDKRYLAKMLPIGATVKDCEVASTYTAKWRWDLGLYMAYAEINVFKDGNKVGGAVYDSMRGGANMGKFIDADAKIKELTNQVFP